ncbi:MAG: hypothetical protein ACR2JB_25470 [Bryobacteraceae bacterium]
MRSSRSSTASLPKLKLLTPDQIAAERRRRKRRSIDRCTGLSGVSCTPNISSFSPGGATHRERLLMVGNRCGKTVAGAYELTLHLTGLYPDWWEGADLTEQSRHRGR